ncbi:hypothetical protein JKP88DRAFT_327238 [Tribonema minus]|uniref:Uncharacterized protein n=1 Tax=Tribonema minus TaxID=303371 RepID=A0A835YQ40_9STRA|nr:hypothetical protein JKP88DRAFT_327238 [Tribonema minus]
MANQKLTIILDINKTIVMADPAGGQTEDDVCNSVLSEVACGRIDDTSDPPRWHWAGGAVCPRHELADPTLVSYADFVHARYADTPLVGMEENQLRKAARRRLKCRFTEPGMAGEGLRGAYTAMQRALRLPRGARAHPAAAAAGLADRATYFIVPAYFDLITTLARCGANFNIQFASFGTDLPRVAREHDAYCAGAHPLSHGPRLDGTDARCGRVDLRIGARADARAALYRDAAAAALVLVTLEVPASRAALPGGGSVTSSAAIAEWLLRARASAVRHCYRHWRDSLEDAHAGNLVFLPCVAAAAAPTTRSADALRTDKLSVDTLSASVLGDVPSADTPSTAAASVGDALGADAADADAMMSTDAPRAARDGDSLNADTRGGGDLLSNDARGCGSGGDCAHHVIVFDDGVEADDAHIVDARCARTGEALGFEAVRAQHLVRAEPFWVSTSGTGRDNYFIREIAKRWCAGAALLERIAELEVLQ